MFVRTAMFACAALVTAAAPSFAEENTARCDTMNVRVYFAQGSATLNEAARETLAAAERQVADCSYAELHVATDTSTRTGRARAEAIRTALNDRAWNATYVASREMLRRASYASGPDFVEVTMSPEPLTIDAPEPRRPEAGV